MFILYTTHKEQNRIARFDRYIQDEYSGANSKPYLSLSNMEYYSYVHGPDIQSCNTIVQKVFDRNYFTDN